MLTQCSRDLFGYEVVEGRQVVAAFDGGKVTSDAGALLLGPTDRAIHVVGRFAVCFADGRAQAQVEHTIEVMVAQRVFGIALGYEDLIDHDQLRHDPVLAALAGKLEAKRKDCAPLAGKSTLNRLEHAPSDPSRYHKIGHDAAAIARLFVELFLEAHRTMPARIVLDLDATDDPLHGHQEGRFFHGYYDCYCYLSLYVFCGRQLLAAKLRRSNIDASAGVLVEVERIVGQIRARWPRVEILLRADSGFARDELMAWCEANGVDYVFGLARNERLVGAIAPDLAEPRPRAWPAVVRRAASPTSYGSRARAGAGSGGSSPRPSICPRGPIRALSSPRSRPARSTLAPSTRTSTAPAAMSRIGDDAVLGSEHRGTAARRDVDAVPAPPLIDRSERRSPCRSPARGTRRLKAAARRWQGAPSYGSPRVRRSPSTGLALRDPQLLPGLDPIRLADAIGCASALTPTVSPDRTV
jgi:Transposase DDE domain group 1